MWDAGRKVELAISESGRTSVPFVMSVRFTLPSDQTRMMLSSITLSHALISIISIHKAQSEHYHIQVTSQV
jgi:hypothetical protein